MDVTIKKFNEQDLKKMGVFAWPIWEKGVSKFDWHYDSQERCFFLEGRVVLETGDGKRFEFGKGDFVTFAQGLSCVWDIKEPVKKHYNFL
ncbi:MAG: cupin domain-containing protein [Candidatus Omnitrophota bacterium]